MSDPSSLSSQVVVGLTSGLIASIATSLVTPFLHNYYWKHQRRAELCLSLIEEFAGLMARFISEYARCWKFPLQNLADEDSQKLRQFFWEWQSICERMRAVFSAETWNKSGKIMMQISELSGGTRDPAEFGKLNIENYSHARDEALSALYREIGMTSDRFLGGQLQALIGQLRQRFRWRGGRAK